ncbi:transposase, partial [Candidatus Gottesmanbacteria bacterium]|nr:transposase [Candidatus Gottesmanbacteria bacterium]
MYQLRQIPSEAQIKKGIRQSVFGRNVYCPACKSQRVLVFENRYRCRNCSTKFSLLSNTFLANLKLP